jgi:hypothetical protein
MHAKLGSTAPVPPPVVAGPCHRSRRVELGLDEVRSRRDMRCLTMRLNA